MTLELAQTAVGAINDGHCTLTTAKVDSQPILVSSRADWSSSMPHSRSPLLRVSQLGASRDRIVLLDEDCSLLDSLPFELAFPLHSALTTTVQAVAFDVTSGRVRRAEQRSELYVSDPHWLLIRLQRRPRVASACGSAPRRPGESTPASQRRTRSLLSTLRVVSVTSLIPARQLTP